MAVLIYPNVKEAMKVYFSNLPELATFMGDNNDHVFFRIPDAPPWPLVVISGPVFGGADNSYVPSESAWWQFDCWAQPTEPGRQPREKQAADLSLLVQGALQGIEAGTVVNNTRILWAQVISRLPVSDPDTLQARYSITAEISAIAA